MPAGVNKKGVPWERELEAEEDIVHVNDILLVPENLAEFTELARISRGWGRSISARICQLLPCRSSIF